MHDKTLAERNLFALLRFIKHIDEVKIQKRLID